MWLLLVAASGVALLPLEQLDALAEEYGPVFMFRLLGKDYVHLGSYSAIREAYVKLGDCFVGRPRDSTAMGYLLDHQGISNSEGHEWTEHRRFVLHTLRDFCFGKLSVLDRVQDAAHRLVGRVAAQGGRPFDPEPLIFEAVVATMAGLLFDVEYEDEQGAAINASSSAAPRADDKSNENEQQQTDGGAVPADDATKADERRDVSPAEAEDEANLARLVRLVAKATPLLNNDVLPQLWTCASPVELSPGFSELQRLKRELDDFLERMIADHEPSLDELKTICVDLLVSGTASSVAQLCWTLKLLARHPQCQRRCQDEMDAVLASADQLGSVFSKDNLPFTEACLLESARFASVHMVAAPRTNVEEASVCGFRVPAGSRVLANLWLAHRDTGFWREPHRFDPTRFLAEDGRPERKDAFLPFGLGKRVCIGESLAKTQMFVFVTELLKRFTFTLPEEFATQDLSFRPSQGTLRFAEPFHLRAGGIRRTCNTGRRAVVHTASLTPSGGLLLSLNGSTDRRLPVVRVLR
ncbi:hypothetical protein MTO96_023747 [Rhipicephalus appendiculatus]